MSQRVIKTDKALDTIVMDWIQRFEKIKSRCISTIEKSPDDEYIISIFDPATDHTLTASFSPWGNELIYVARAKMKRKRPKTSRYLSHTAL